MILTLDYHTAEFLGKSLLIFLHCKQKKVLKKQGIWGSHPNTLLIQKTYHPSLL